MKIAVIPAEFYPEYRTDVMFDGYKWDLQANAQSTISDKVLLLNADEAVFLAENAVKLYHETIEMERALHKNPQHAVALGISAQMADALCGCEYDSAKNIRFMRFDFHPTTCGWRISEVNSDVPAGYPEASVLPALAQKYFDGYERYGCFGEIFTKKLAALVSHGETIAYLHDTHTVEDYQILHYIGDLMEKRGCKSVYASPQHVNFCEGSTKIGDEKIAAILRYFPVEWLECTPNIDWRGFINTKTPQCNHPIALLTQSKRLPLVWDKLNVDIPAWKKFLPQTLAPFSGDFEKWILKPAFGRVGEGINVPGTVSPEEEAAIIKAAENEPTQWVAQKMFESLAIDGVHVNVGAFVIDGEFAGFYARISATPKIDEDASEIPILVGGVHS
jgi:glutathionylspermidine synthase